MDAEGGWTGSFSHSPTQLWHRAQPPKAKGLPKTRVLTQSPTDMLDGAYFYQLTEPVINSSGSVTAGC